jgi:TrmH family RNA methyltransferase
MGAHFRLPIVRSTWDEIRERAEGMFVCLADKEGRPIWECDFRRPSMLMVGGEAAGASFEAQRFILTRGRPGRTLDSLNAAVAGSIVMFEIARQRA